MITSKRHFVRANGVDLHVLELGPARPAQLPPLLLLHGISDTHLTWSKVAPALAERRRVIMPDLAGHGLSGRPDASYALDWHAAMIGALLDAMDLGRVDVAGHSYGGGVAQWLLLAHRERVRRMMLVASGGLGRDVSAELRIASLGLIEHVGQPFFGVGTRIGLAAAGGHFDRTETSEIAWMASRPGTARALSRTVEDVIDLDGQRRHFLERAAEIRSLPPLAFAWGDRDRVLPFRHATDALAILEGAPLSRYEGCGHFPHRESPLRFTSELEAFLDADVLPTPRLVRAVRVQVDHDRPLSTVLRAWRSVVHAVRRLFGAPPPKVTAPALPAERLLDAA
jgi:pimeloyl-ACP methyl ester carboxylesterase